MSSKSFSRSKVKLSAFGQRLREAFKNPTNQAIAKELKLSKAALTTYMQGRIPPADKLVEISKLTNCNLHWLLTGQGSKRISFPSERPQGIIIQGSKGGIGASTTALLIAATLSLKGYGVLYADDHHLAGTGLFYPEKNRLASLFSSHNRNEELAKSHSKETELPSHNRKEKLAKLPSKETDFDYDNDFYLPTPNKNLDLFLPRTWVEEAPSKEEIKFFKFDTDEIYSRYQFVIFDSQLNENPFYYGNYTHQIFKPEQVLRQFVLEPILRNAKVIVPFDVIQSTIGKVKRTIEFVKYQQKIYPEAGFAGIFLNEQSRDVKQLKEIYKLNLAKLEEAFEPRLFQSRISHHKEIRNYRLGFEKTIFNRKTRIHREFSLLVDELLQKIGY